MWKNTICAIMCATILVACVGRAPQLIPSVQPNDKRLACNQIEAEIIQRQNSLLDLETEKANRQKRNIGMGIAGFFLIIPWFFMDLGTAPETEATAINKRLNTLKRYANTKDCDIAY